MAEIEHKPAGSKITSGILRATNTTANGNIVYVMGRVLINISSITLHNKDIQHF